MKLFTAWLARGLRLLVFVTWLFWLTLAVIAAGVAAVTGAQPSGTRPVSGTRLMGVARLVLLMVAGLFAYFALRAHGTI